MCTHSGLSGGGSRKQREKLIKYEQSLTLILDIAVEKERVTLEELRNLVSEQTELQKILIPNVDIFKEIMVELIKSKEIDLAVLRKEKSEYIVEDTLDFQLNDMILSIVDKDDRKRTITRIYIYRTEDKNGVKFTNVCDEQGGYRTILCSNVEIRVEM